MMDQQMLFKQMIDFQKQTLDNSFNAMTLLQKQGEEMVKAFLGQASWLPHEGKSAIKDWLDAYTKGREQFMTLVEGNFKKVEEIFGGMESKKWKPSSEDAPNS